MLRHSSRLVDVVTRFVVSAFVVVVLGGVVGLGGCAHVEAPSAASTAPSVGHDEVVAVLPRKLVDRGGWADDVLAAIASTGKAPTKERVCAVVAVVEQESGFAENPAVRDLPAIVRRALDDKLAPLGPLAPAARDALLSMRPPGSADDATTFGARVDRLKTERDLDRLFRELHAAVAREHPGGVAVAGALALLSGRGGLEDLNPVTTAGSMQVKVSFARTLEPKLNDDAVREWLYTRGGGVRAGTARLLGYDAHYDDVVYRFADYNAGVYASRNAAFQELVGALSGMRLVPDGDLLLYDHDGAPKNTDSRTLSTLVAQASRLGLSERQVRRDVKLEKSIDFERTDTWRAVRETYLAATGKAPPYARVPDVELSSPKMTKARTTSWFSSSVKARYARCRAQL
jgi:hypothetical protein